MKTLFHRIILLTLVVSAIVIAVALAAFLVYSGVVERETRHFEAIQEGSSRPSVIAGEPESRPSMWGAPLVGSRWELSREK